MEALLPVVLGLLFVGGLIVAWHVEQRRREALRGFCLAKGWTFADRDDAWCRRWVGEPFRNNGSDERASNVMRGSYGERALVAFDYSYETESHDAKGRRRTTTHRYAVCALQLPAPLSTLQVTAENIFTRAAGLLGGEDIELESEDFNRRYRVSAPDRKFAFDVLHPRTMHALLALPTVSWRIEGDWVVAWDAGRNAAGDVMRRAATMAAVVAGVPSFVWRDHGAPTPGGALA